MIVARDEMVITFDGSSAKVRDAMRTARVSLYLAKPDEHGAIRYGIDVEPGLLHVRLLTKADSQRQHGS